jgi:hypothetical protein
MPPIRVSTRGLREIAARRLAPSTARELILRLPDQLTPEDLIRRLATILEVSEIESGSSRGRSR